MKLLMLVCAVLWISAVGTGIWYLTRYENKGADKDVAYPSIFPTESHLVRDPNRSTLLFFAHPKCPCTRASLAELERLLADVNGKLRVYMVFYKPADEGDDWTDTELRGRAETIPNLQVVIDEDGRETDIFNAQTSGLTLLYDASGNLRFDGGITAARGREGDNAGRQAIFDIVTQQPNQNTETFVFGCPLHNKDCKAGSMQYAQ